MSGGDLLQHEAEAGKRKFSQSHLEAKLPQAFSHRQCLSASEDVSCEVDWLTQKMRDANFTVSGWQRSVYRVMLLLSQWDASFVLWVRMQLAGFVYAL